MVVSKGRAAAWLVGVVVMVGAASVHAAPRYVFEALAPVGDEHSRAYALNNEGVVVGESYTWSVGQATVWHNGSASLLAGR